MPRVLLIDDNPAFLFSLAEALRVLRTDFLVETAASAEDALLLIAVTEYDAIISDVRLPGMDGLELLEKCQGLRPDTPIILLTGHGDILLEHKAARRGAYGVLHKPIDPAELLAVVSRATLHAPWAHANTAVPPPIVADPFVNKSQAILSNLKDSSERLQQKIHQWTQPKPR